MPFPPLLEEHMKKTRILSLVLLLTLLLHCLLLPVFAEPESSAGEPSDPISESASLPEEPTQDTQASTEDTIDAPSPLLDYALDNNFYVRAKAAALIDLDAGALLFGMNIDEQVYPASLTKIMTCMIALERGNPDDILTVSSAALQDLAIGGSTANLKVGEQLSLRELLYCVMVSSANEACNVVAEYISGSIPAFVALMNDYAAKLGMTATHYVNTHGLHEEGHYTTVRDLSTLARWAWAHDDFREYATTTVHTVPATNLSEERELHTTNYLTSGLTVGKYYYDKASGMKTGFTSKAGGCLIATAHDGDVNLLSIVCGCDKVQNDDGTETDERFTESKGLLEFGFSHFSYVQVLSNTTMVGMPDVLYAEGRGNVVVRAKDNISVLLPNDCQLSEIETQVKYLTDGQLEAPLDAGQIVGTVTAVYHGNPIASSDLVTLTAVKRSVPQYVADKTNDAVGGFFGKLMKMWYLSIPLLLLLVLIAVLFILRAVNIRKAKKRSARRRARRNNHE